MIMARRLTIASAIVLTGATAYWLGSRHAHETFPSDEWLIEGELNLEGQPGYIGYRPDALFGVDIPLPEITTMSVQAKLVEREDYHVGYVAGIAIESLDITAIPEQYREGRTIEYDTGPVTVQPLAQVSYEVRFEFELLDANS